MKLDEAIEILALEKTCDFEGAGQDLEDAIQLGIEALRREKENRENPVQVIVGWLPGETED